MGSFNSTCAITRTAISEYDKVLLVIIKEGAPKDTYNLVNKLASIKRSAEINECLKKAAEFIEDEKYRATIEKILANDKILEFIGIGTYDDGGSIYEYEDTSYVEPERVFLVHVEAAEVLIGEALDESQLEDQLLTICEKAYLARIQLFGNYYIGMQNWDEEELDIQEKILNVTQSIINKRRVILKEQEEENKVLDLEDYMDLEILKELE